MDDELHRRIAERAYSLFLARGGEHGHDEEDWLRAEAEIRLELEGEVKTAKPLSPGPRKTAGAGKPRRASRPRRKAGRRKKESEVSPSGM